MSCGSITNILQYRMKANLSYTPFQVVTWYSWYTPDYTGAFSGYAPNVLLNISIDGQPTNLAGPEQYTLPTGPAGGDLSSCYPTPLVVGIDGFPINTSIGPPTNGQGLTYNATDGYLEWTTNGGGATSLLLTGDTTSSGGTTNSAVTHTVKINGASVPVFSAAFANGNVLQVNSVAINSLTYAPINLAGGTNYVTGALPSANQVAQTMGGAVNGTTAASTISLTSNSHITGVLPAANQANQALTLTGDVTSSGGTTGGAVTTVAKIQGVVISGTPSSGYVLEATSSTAASWQSPSGGTVTLSGDVTGASSSNTVDKIQGNTVTSGALVKGDLLIATTTSNWAATAVTGDVSFSTSTPGLTSVMKINGTSVPASPTSGQVLTATSGTSATWQSNAATVTWANDVSGNSTSSNTHQYISSLSYSSATAGGSIAVNGTNTLLNWATNAITLQQGATTLLQLKAASTDFIYLGTSSGTTGLLRTPVSSTIIGSAGTSVLSVDSSPNVTLNGSTSVTLSTGGTAQLTTTSSYIEVAPESIYFTQSGGTTSITYLNTVSSGTGATLNLAAQSGGSSVTGGSLVLSSGSGGVNPGLVTMNAGSVQVLSLGTSAIGGAFFNSALGNITWSNVIHQGDSSSLANASFNFKTLASAINVAGGGTFTLTAAQAACPIIPLTGSFSGDLVTIVVPNNVGATWFFDLTATTNVESTLIFSTGTGTPVSLLTDSFLQGGKTLVTVCVRSSNFVSAG